MRIAFTLIGGKKWTGGYNYLRNLLTALSKSQMNRVTSVLFVGQDVPEAEVIDFFSIPNVKVVRTPILNFSRKHELLIRSLVFGRDVYLAELFRKHCIDVVFEAAQYFGWRLDVPAIAWMPDFQHRIFPELFSKFMWWKREFGFQAQVLSGRTIMLSSNDARNDCERYYPSTKGRTSTVHFAVDVSSPIFYEEARGLADSYGLPEHFFFLPNQFWKHKNHKLVLDALSILKQRGKKIVVVCSGAQEDPRDPSYFPDFLRKIEENRLSDNILLLGLVPYSHLIMLMRASSALLNPSLFEGWSTTVEEARAIGTPMVLSDLSVHREQMGHSAIYFDRRSADSLANALEGFVPMDREARSQYVADAKKNARERFVSFARDFTILAEQCQSRGRDES